jgi:pre-mRNA-splicing helicase BRR2
VGKIDRTAMGLNSSRDKPKKQVKKTKPKTEAWEFKGGNILEEKFDDSLYYRPKTKENKLIYEKFLGKIYEMVQDQPPEILQAIADEILAIIKSDNPEAKKRA